MDLKKKKKKAIKDQDVDRLIFHCFSDEITIEKHRLV